jgi:NosR/NirI family nitrous oxide reductase transcriptional regulator
MLIGRYMHWLHTRWPAGKVERLPECGEGGRTNLKLVRIVGDLTGIPLLKFASAGGANAARAVAAELQSKDGSEAEYDLAIIGGGVSGIAAAIEARKAGLKFAVFEATQTFSTIANFPARKPIFTYPTGMKLDGGLQFSTDVKEALLEELEAQRTAAQIEITPARIERLQQRGDVVALHKEGGGIVTARRAIVAIGRSGNHRKLGVPGEDLPNVYNRLHDPKEFSGRRALVVGGGDSALETAIALALGGAHVTLSYRRAEFSRAKPENIAKVEALARDPDAAVQVEEPNSERVTTSMTSGLRTPGSKGSVTLALGSEVEEITATAVRLRGPGDAKQQIPNDVVFTMLGREAPLDFFRRSGLNVRGDWRPLTWVAATLFLLFCVGLYHWKSNHPQELAVQRYFQTHRWFPAEAGTVLDRMGESVRNASHDSRNLLYTVRRGLGNPSFYYTLAYCSCVVGFGIRRMRRRRTPYVTLQTWTLIAFQCVPLFILPELLLPWMGRNGWFEQGQPLRWIADQLFETYDGGLGHERAYWRAYGFILAWPLNVYNVFTEHPLPLWLAISVVQTFVLIPLLIWRWGKGAYCGWICSCGALAETMGDAHRHKMPHGPFWNRLNMLGQAILVWAFVLLALRIGGWVGGEGSWPAHAFHRMFEGIPFLNYSWSVDILLGGILGVGLYFWFSGRTWCRFACPLAALMHIYTRFSRYRIFPEKSKCISCNVCTSVCHQGIDVMNFANKGMPMEDPECVRCSACVQECPTGVLSFGRLDRAGEKVLDRTPASRVQMQEKGS